MKKHIHQFGFKLACLYWGHRLLQRLSLNAGIYPYAIVRQPLKAVSKSRKSKFFFEQIETLDDNIKALPRPVDVIAERFAAKHKCYVAYNAESEFSGCIWIARSQYIEDEVRIRFVFPDSSCWDYDVYIVPRYRIGRLFAYLWDYTSQSLVDDEVKHTYSRISRFNPNSLRSHQSLGADIIGNTLCVKLGRLEVFFSDIGPRMHIGLTSCPTVVLKGN